MSGAANGSGGRGDELRGWAATGRSAVTMDWDRPWCDDDQESDGRSCWGIKMDDGEREKTFV